MRQAMLVLLLVGCGGTGGAGGSGGGGGDHDAVGDADQAGDTTPLCSGAGLPQMGACDAAAAYLECGPCGEDGDGWAFEPDCDDVPAVRLCANCVKARWWQPHCVLTEEDCGAECAGAHR